MAGKVYAIKSGFNKKKNEKVENLIVNTWSECSSYIHGVKGAKYKSFATRKEAEEYLNDKTMLKKSDGTYPKDCLHAYVDGSYNVHSRKYSYGVIYVRNNIVEGIDGGFEKADENEANIRQIAGELKGAETAAKFAAEHNEKEIVIFHDYEGIASHATGAWSRNEPSSVKYYNTMQKYMKNGVKITFVKVDGHTGDLFNELADEKCKQQLGIPSTNAVKKYLKDNFITAVNDEIKIELQKLIPECSNKILILGEKAEKENISENIAEIKKGTRTKCRKEILEKFSEIKDMYANDEESAKKIISKMLSKEKEEFIYYILSQQK